MQWHRLRRFIPIRRLREPAPVVAVLRLAGVLTPQGGPMRQALNLAALAGPVEQAFKLRGLKAVALAINSPGGSPVQSALIHDRIRALATEKDVPVIAFCEDVAASGGYWIACAGDEIYANDNSVVGSIGVISGGFGFEELLAKVGVERRVYTAGDKKSFMDPFLPEKEEDVKRLTSLAKDMHQAFKEHVRTRRGDKLKGSDELLFSGEFWLGTKAVELGLIDGIGDLRGTMRERYGERVRLRLVEPGKGWLRRRIGIDGLVSGAGDWAENVLAAAEARAMWARYGL